MEPSFNYYYRIDLTVRRYTSAGATESLTYKFVDRHAYASTSYADYYPILKSIPGEIVLASGIYLPTVSAGEFTIDNTIGSFGWRRKFSDVLQRYTAVEQAAVFYIGVAASDSNDTPTWTQVASGTVNSWKASPADGGQDLTFSVRTTVLKDRVLNLEVASTVSGMTSAPANTLGKAVPVSIGTGGDVIPVRVSANGSTSPRWAIGTCHYQYLKDDLSARTLYTLNADGAWQQATFLPVDYTAFATSTQYSLLTYEAQAYTTDNNVIATGVRLSAKGSGAAAFTSSATLTAFVLRYDVATYQVLEEVTSGRTSLSLYDASNQAGTAAFNVDICFDKPVFTGDGGSVYGFAVGFRASNAAASDLSLNNTSVFSTAKGFIHDKADSGGGSEYKVLTGQKYLKHLLLVPTATYTDHVSAATESGLTYSRLDLTLPTPASGQTNPDFDNFPLLISNVSGGKDYTSGTVYAFYELFDKLDATWNGSAWVSNGNWTARYSSRLSPYFGGDSTRHRSVSKVYNEKVTFLQFVDDFCKGAACRIGVLSTGKLFIFPWGSEYTVVGHIPSQDFTLVSMETLGAETVVNRVTIKTAASITQTKQAAWSATFSDESFSYSYDFAPTSGGAIDAMTKASRAMYGDRSAASGEFPFVITDTAYLGSKGSYLAESILAQNREPRTYVTFIAPYHKYNSFEMFDVITISSTELPAYYGTDPSASEPVYSDATTASTNLTDGNEWVRAETYRVLIESKTYVVAVGHAPALKFTVQILQNYPVDPT